MNSIKKNFFFSTFLTISNYVFPLITYPYVSRVLQVERIGLCNFVDSIINYFILFSMLGISTYGIREIAKNKSDKTKLNQTFYDLISINILMSILLCFIPKIRKQSQWQSQLQ
ncbi:oligosaccharide flippase family protein [Bacteroides uniformis]|uniref:oligosaccharide flippase family protein n=1 Tax=Bacteroides uniformis TaxID=820 RepID=UPI000556C061|nr:oligosaccharide flippase family protein [Bacteroides uniformis]